jgi:hypothetical protein
MEFFYLLAHDESASLLEFFARTVLTYFYLQLPPDIVKQQSCVVG